MPYYLFAWIASVSAALILIISKLTSKHAIPNPWLFNFLWTAITVIFVIPPALYFGASFPKDWVSIIITSIFGVLWYIGYIFALYRLDVSTLSPLFNFRTLFAVLIGIVFLQESFTMEQSLYFMVVLIAGMFATIDEKFSIRSFFTPSIGIGLLAMVFLAINNAFIKIAVDQNDIWTVNLWTAIISLILLLSTIPLFKKDLRRIKFNQLIPIAGMGVIQTVTNYTLAVALAANVSVTTLIMSIPFSMIFAFIFSLFAPNLLEKHTAKVYIIRFASAIIMIYAALQLSG